MLTLSSIGQSNVVNPFGANQFVSTWKTSNTSTGSSTATQIKLPLISGGTYNFVVEWGDGTSDTITTNFSAATTHTYAVAGIYQIKITGTCYGWQFNLTGDRLKILSIEKWGNAFRLGNGSAYFYGCENLELQQVDDVLDLTGTTTFANMFNVCSKLTKVGRINEWNTSSITSMVNVFTNAYNFDDNIGAWDVANVNSMAGMFNVTVPISVGRGRFNNGGSDTIKNWNTANVTSLQTTFQNQIKFNQEVGLWNTVKNTSLFGTFSVTSTFGVFNNAGSSSIGSWNTSLVTNMQQAFSNQPFFNQNIGSWNTANVTNLSYMFNNNWAIGVFNNGGSSTINSWNTAKVTTIQQMFNFQSFFNQPINSWNTSLVNTMSDLFYSATAFNQLINNWNVSLVTTFQSVGYGFMGNKTSLNYSSANYDALLIGWASRPVLANKSINFGTIKYTSAATAARAILTSAPNNWTIIDGGLV